MHKTQRKLLSQNFLCNRELVKKLIRDSSIRSSDTVLEIGPGRGIITEQLLNVAREVVAIELDPSLYTQLKQKFSDPKLSLIQRDFLDYSLPNRPYKVFSNIPFSITADIVRKLLNSALSEAYLVVQSEAASKFIANSYRNTLVAILRYPWWEIKIIHRFNRDDFFPRPEVDSVLLNLKRRPVPLVPDSHREIYLDYLAYFFGRDKFAKYTPPAEFLKSFFKAKNLRLVRGSFAKLQNEQSRLEKIHRTRTDSDWKRYNKTHAK